MATSNATPTVDLLGKQIELLERHEGRSEHVSGTVKAVVCSTPESDVHEAVFVNGEWRQLEWCEIITVQ